MVEASRAEQRYKKAPGSGFLGFGGLGGGFWFLGFGGLGFKGGLGVWGFRGLGGLGV